MAVMRIATTIKGGHMEESRTKAFTLVAAVRN